MTNESTKGNKHEQTDFFSAYLDYVDLDQSECPAIYHRWGCASVIGTLLGRAVWVPFGHSVIYPNQYVMLMGPPASKKGTAIGVCKRLLKEVGYTRFSADRTSKEAFLKGMKQFEAGSPEDVAELEALVLNAPSETFICAGEFVDFIGQGDTGFMMTLTNLWDNLPEYTHPKITGKDVHVDKPTVNMFGGSTPTTFALAFPPEAMGSGFLSRVLLIHSDGSGNKIPWPSPADPLKTALLVERLKVVKTLKGEMEFIPSAYELVGTIYKNAVPVDDSRFVHYMDRRHTHLIKNSMIQAAADGRLQINEKDVIRANTMLACAEMRMGKALGEFGASKYAAASNMVLEVLRKAKLPMNSGDIWKHVSRDVSKMQELIDILENLKRSEKIQVHQVRGKTGYLPHNKPAVVWDPVFIDSGWLTDQENFL